MSHANLLLGDAGTDCLQSTCPSVPAPRAHPTLTIKRLQSTIRVIGLYPDYFVLGTIKRKIKGFLRA